MNLPQPTAKEPSREVIDFIILFPVASTLVSPSELNQCL